MNSKNKIGSPSARRREHIHGRWIYRADLTNQRENLIHNVKQVIGFLIPWLLLLLPVFLATSRAATEIASWGLAIFTLLYIGSDAFSTNREFKFFRLGPDLSLASFLFFGLLSVLFSLFEVPTSSEYGAGIGDVLLEGLGHLRWIPLLYLFAYAWELFPGLNRVVVTLIGAVTAIAIVAWIQHFQGVDWLTGETLPKAPTGDHSYFIPRGFFGSTEALATLFACILPFPVAAACLRRDQEETDKFTWFGFAIALVIAIALVFTYRLGLWWAGMAGAVALLLFPGDRRLKFLVALIASIAAVWILLFTVFDSSSSTLGAEQIWQRIQDDEQARGEQHRIQMNGLVKVWEKSPLLGIAGATPGILSEDAQTGTQYESVNIYFLILTRSGLVGLVLYLAFIMHHLLCTLRLFHEIPASHHRHRVLAAGCFGSQCAFHAAGLYWGTMTEAFSMNLFILISSMTLYMTEHYAHGLVPDDNAL